MNRRVCRADLLPFRLPLRRPWTFHDQRVDARQGWIVRLEDASGLPGWGEATPLPEIGTETAERCGDWLRRRTDALPGRHPAEVLAELMRADGLPPAAHFGLETALLDLSARRRRRPLAELLHPRPEYRLPVNAAAGSLLAVTGHSLRAIRRAGFASVKLKVGIGPLDSELARLASLWEDLPEGLGVRFDANRAWNPAQARRFLQALTARPVELLEEPLTVSQLDQLAALTRAAPLPLALDESLPGLPPQQATAARCWILKPMLLGGLRRCMHWARRAADSGIACLVTTTVDGAIASHAAGHLAAAVRGLAPGPAHGLATSALLTHDYARGPVIERGHLLISRSPGLGESGDISL